MRTVPYMIIDSESHPYFRIFSRGMLLGTVNEKTGKAAKKKFCEEYPRTDIENLQAREILRS